MKILAPSTNINCLINVPTAAGRRVLNISQMDFLMDDSHFNKTSQHEQIVLLFFISYDSIFSRCANAVWCFSV